MRWAPAITGALLGVAVAVLALAQGAPQVAPGSPLAPTAPPGWSVLAALATLVPVGDVGVRLVALSALGAAVAGALLVRLVLDSGREPVADVMGGIAGVALLGSTAAWVLPAGSVGPVSVEAALALGAVTALDRMARGAGAGAGVAATACVAWLAAMVPASRWLLVPLAAIWIVRIRHGARWPLLLPAVLVLVWGMAALQPVVRRAATPRAPVAAAHQQAPAPATGTSARYLEALADELGPVGVVAAVGGMVVLLGRGRRSRWLALSVAALLGAGLMADELTRVGPLVVVAAALAAAVAVARLLRRIEPAVGRACVGAACAVIMAVPAAFATAERVHRPPAAAAPR